MEPFHSTHPSTFRTFYDNDDHHVVLDRSGEVLSRTDRSKVQQNVQEDTNTQMRGSREHNESDVPVCSSARVGSQEKVKTPDCDFSGVMKKKSEND